MNSINLMLQNAKNALAVRNFDQVNSTCNSILASMPNNYDACHLLALSAKQQKQYNTSEKHFKRSLFINSDQTFVLSNYANLLTVMGKLEQANSFYSKSLKKSSNNLDALYNWASLLYRRELYDDAIDKIRSAIAINPKNATYFCLLGLIFNKTKQYINAIDSYDKALNIKPLDYLSCFYKGITLRESNKANEAIECYLLIYGEGVNSPEFLFNLACAYYDIEVFDKTEQLLKQALSLKPDYIEAHEALNKYYWEHAKKELFLNSYPQAIATKKQSVELRYSFASTLIMAGKNNDAEEVLKQAVRECGPHPELNHALAVLIGRSKKYEESLPLFLSVIKQKPESIRFRLDIANVFIQLGEYQNAILQLDEAHKIMPLNQEVWSFKGICWRLLGDEREKWLNNYDTFVKAQLIDTPEGYDNLEHFLNEFRYALNDLHNSDREPLDQSVRGGTQTTGHLLFSSQKVIVDYKHALTKCVSHYLQQLPKDASHPFLNRQTNKFIIDGCWSVRLANEGFHVNHVHPLGWLSGPTYIDVPESISESDPTKSGWVKFGETALDLGSNELIAHEVCPKPGLCVFFPSYMWHGTHAFKSTEYRMTVPCDIMPK